MWRKNMHGGREGGGGVYSSLFLFFFCRTALPQLGLFPEREEVEEGGAWKIPFPLFQSCTLPSACVFACDVAMASGVCVCVCLCTNTGICQWLRAWGSKYIFVLKLCCFIFLWRLRFYTVLLRGSAMEQNLPCEAAEVSWDHDHEKIH